VSIRDKVVDGIGSLVDRVKNSDDLPHINAAKLEKELRDRVKLHNQSSGNTNPIATMAGPGEDARKRRAAAAQKREARIHSDRERRAAQAKAAQEDAFRRMREQAAQDTSRRGGYQPGSGSSSRPRVPRSVKGDLAQHYKVLDLAPGADFAEVKKAYRKLMRKYHPDLHQDPRKKKAATELTVKVTQAYNALDKALNGS
jgi:DnaJ-domain-containing protein 1